MSDNLLTQEQAKFPCFHGWVGRTYVTCVHHEICKLVMIVDKTYVPAPLHMHISCDKAEFPKVPREKKEKTKEAKGE